MRLGLLVTTAIVLYSCNEGSSETGMSIKVDASGNTANQQKTTQQNNHVEKFS